MNRHFLAVVLAVLLLGGLVTPAEAGEPVPASNRIAIRAGRLIDGESAPARTNVIILVENGRITALGENLSIPPGTQVIELSTATVLPGLIDNHAHVLTRPGDSLRGFLARSSARKALDGMRHARTLLEAGFTTLRVPGDEDVYYATVEIRNAIARGEFVGPRLLVAPHFLSPTGGHGDLNELAPDVLVMGDGRIVNGTEEMRRAVREEIKYGADWIKLFATGGVMSTGDDPRAQAFTNEELRAAVEEAHRLGKKVCAHAHGAGGLIAAVRAGVDSIEHAALADEAAIREMMAHGTYLVPTLYVANFIVNEGAQRGIPEERLEKARQLLPLRQRAIRAAIQAGVKIAFGTDTGVFPHGHGVREFALLVEAGMTPMQAIRSATAVAAEMLGLAGEIGTLAVGKQADLIAVVGNPLENVRVLEDVKFVMKAGQVVKNAF